ncbi:MAG: lysoplasmalogenase family protein [Flavobacteriaceae bacterium]
MTTSNLKSGTIVLCLLVFIADTFFRVQQAETIRFFSKPMIILSLYLYYWVRVNKRKIIFELALFSNLIADIFFLFDLKSDLILALAIFFFGFAHLVYAILVLQMITSSKRYTYLMGILFFGSYALIYFRQSFSKFDQIAVLVYLYAFIEIFFGTICFVYFFQKIGWQRFSILAATLLFFVSDILTGYNNFLFESHFFTYGIGIAYCLGQFLVVQFFTTKYAVS